MCIHGKANILISYIIRLMSSTYLFNCVPVCLFLCLYLEIVIMMMIYQRLWQDTITTHVLVALRFSVPNLTEIETPDPCSDFWWP